MAYKRRTLEMEADRIEAVLAKHKVPARVRGGTVTPGFVRYEIVTEMGSKVSKVTALAEEIALALGKSEARVYRRNGEINVEFARPKPAAIRLLTLAAELEAVPACTAVLGVEGDGTPLLLRLAAPDAAHVLIAGTTGSGKTALARTLLVSLAMHNPRQQLRLALIDPKGHGLGPLIALSHVAGHVAKTTDEAASMLTRIVAEMERRDRAQVDSPALIVAVDELADLLQTGGQNIERALSRIAQRGRQAGIHLVACTQKPTSALIGSAMKANFPVRLVGSVASKEEARYASGLADSGAEKLDGPGDFLLVAKGNAIRFRAAWIGPTDLRHVAEETRDGAVPKVWVAPPLPTAQRKARSGFWQRIRRESS